MDAAVIRARGGPNISAAAHALPLSPSEKAALSTFLRLLAAFFILVPFSYLPATYAAFSVRERAVKARHRAIAPSRHRAIASPCLRATAPPTSVVEAEQSHPPEAAPMRGGHRLRAWRQRIRGGPALVASRAAAAAQAFFSFVLPLRHWPLRRCSVLLAVLCEAACPLTAAAAEGRLLADTPCQRAIYARVPVCP